MTARDYPCPDCEDALGPCPGFGCPAKGMETFPFRRVVVCAAPKRKPEPAVVVIPEGSKPCRSCGKPFKPKWSHHRACSDECRRAVRHVGRVLGCDWCGKDFVQTVPRQKRCSRACMKEHRREFERLRSVRRRKAVSS